MDRERLRGPEGSDQGRRKRARGLQIKERDGHWHIQGTLTVSTPAGGRRTERIRQSTGLPATPDTRLDAEAIADGIKTRFRAELVHGVKPSQLVAQAALAYLQRPRERPLGATSIAVVKAIELRFRGRDLSSIDATEWDAFVRERTEGRKSATRERYLNAVEGFINWCSSKPREWITEARKPVFDRDNKARNPNRRARRRVGELSDELILFLISHAAPHLKAQLAAEWATGARVSSVLRGARVADVILAEGREQIRFWDTKNGLTVTAAIPPIAAEMLREYAEWRGRLHAREEMFFVTHKRKPYRGRINPNRTAFNAAKRRAAAAKRRAAAIERVKGDKAASWLLWGEAKLIEQVTQHWFRHLLATRMRGDLRAAMDQGGWIDPRSVMSYTLDVEASRRELINELFDTKLTREPEPKRKFHVKPKT